MCAHTNKIIKMIFWEWQRGHQRQTGRQKGLCEGLTTRKLCEGLTTRKPTCWFVVLTGLTWWDQACLEWMLGSEQIVECRERRYLLTTEENYKKAQCYSQSLHRLFDLWWFPSFTRCSFFISCPPNWLRTLKIILKETSPFVIASKAGLQLNL